MSYTVGVYQACKTCGSTRVVRETAMAKEDGYELVIISCQGCEGRRARYKRKRKK